MPAGGIGMTPEEYEQLSKNVLAHEYRQQETYQIDGTRYVLEKGNATSIGTEKWVLWMYPEGRFADFVAGDSIEEVFSEAATKGAPVEKLTFDCWHD
jgi:(2Fe-2S) ferredoxin